MEVSISNTCPNCRQRNTRMFDEDSYFNWRAGMLIQNAFPTQTLIEREFLMTGMCSDKCWNEYLGDEE